MQRARKQSVAGILQPRAEFDGSSMTDGSGKALPMEIEHGRVERRAVERTVAVVRRSVSRMRGLVRGDYRRRTQLVVSRIEKWLAERSKGWAETPVDTPALLPSPGLNGQVAPDPAEPILTRAETLLAGVPRKARIIEIGPSFSPIAPKSAGWNSASIDHLTREGLIAKYTGHPGVDVSRIEPVDFVWAGGALSDAVPFAQQGSFDAFVASHVIEHTPDLVAFLDSAALLLKPEGVVILAVPDKRYCFDYFQPLTTTGQLLDAHADRRSRHTRSIAFDHYAYAVADGGIGAWGQRPSEGISFMHQLENASALFAAFESNSDYVDLHAWHFVPASFELLLLELARLGETDWQVERTTPASGCEFFAWLRRGGIARVTALSAGEMAAQRMTLLKRTLLETREQIDWLLAGEAHTDVPAIVAK
jgi:SAM-dependent methyltransferase